MTTDPCPSLLEDLQRLEERVNATFVGRGGWHGLLVLSAPGGCGLRDGRVRRNEWPGVVWSLM